MSQKTFEVTQEFKNNISEILSTKKYVTVYPYMKMIQRDGYLYTEDELNSFIALMEDFSYAEVADFFASIKYHVAEQQPITTNE